MRWLLHVLQLWICGGHLSLLRRAWRSHTRLSSSWVVLGPHVRISLRHWQRSVLQVRICHWHLLLLHLLLVMLLQPWIRSYSLQLLLVMLL